MAEKLGEARMIGDWDKVPRRLEKLAETVPLASRSVRTEAMHSLDRITRNIQGQEYGWSPLAPSTSEAKAKAGQDPRTLIATGDYLASIRVVRAGPLGYGVGVPENAKNADGQSLVAIGLAHEYGTGSLPARPFWRRESREFARNVESRIRRLLERRARGNS